MILLFCVLLMWHLFLTFCLLLAFRMFFVGVFGWFLDFKVAFWWLYIYIYFLGLLFDLFLIYIYLFIYLFVLFWGGPGCVFSFQMSFFPEANRIVEFFGDLFYFEGFCFFFVFCWCGFYGFLGVVSKVWKGWFPVFSKKCFCTSTGMKHHHLALFSKQTHRFDPAFSLSSNSCKNLSKINLPENKQ